MAKQINTNALTVHIREALKLTGNEAATIAGAIVFCSRSKEFAHYIGTGQAAFDSAVDKIMAEPIACAAKKS